MSIWTDLPWLGGAWLAWMAARAIWRAGYRAGHKAAWAAIWRIGDGATHPLPDVQARTYSKREGNGHAAE